MFAEGSELVPCVNQALAALEADGTLQGVIILEPLADHLFVVTLAVAPALFDRIERGGDLEYSGADMEKARSFIPKLKMEASLKDVAAALQYVRAETGKKCGVAGYCFGGSLAWLAATRLKADAAVGYYGGAIVKFLDERPECPVMLHFGKLDKHIPQTDVDKIAEAHREVEIFRYEADHGFNCDARASYDEASAKVARERSLEFLKKYLLASSY